MDSFEDKKKCIFLCLRLVFDVNEKTIKRTTGYSYAVRDLAKTLAADKYEVDCVSVNDEPQLTKWEGINLLSRSVFSGLAHLKLAYLIEGIKLAKSLSVNFEETLRILYYFLFGGWIESILRNTNYDIVSIQGFNRYSYPYILACEKLGLKYTVSFHALDCFEEKYENPDADYMKSMLIHFAKKKVPASFLSQKMKRKAISVLPDSLKDQAEEVFSVIYNGIAPIPKTDSYKEKLEQIPRDSKIALCVGNINARKNQVQVVRALAKIKAPEDIHVVLVGRVIDPTVEREIERLGLVQRVHLIGEVSRSDLFQFYYSSDFVILPSISEGFGLSIIEAFSFGKPVLMWDDLDAANELYDKDAVLLIHGHTDDEMASGIEEILRREWDSNKIINIASRYSIESMANNYAKWYENSFLRSRYE